MTPKNAFASLGSLLIALLPGCGEQPTTLCSRTDIWLTPASTGILNLGPLPVEDYPRLSKFQDAWRIDFYDPNGSGADDQKLEAFSQLDFPRLSHVQVTSGRDVTDEGVRFLSRLRFKALDLSGSSISDRSLELLASIDLLRSLGVVDCQNVSWNGILGYVSASHVESLWVSLAGNTQADVAELIRESNRLTHLGVMDHDSVLDVKGIKRLAEAKGLYVYICQGEPRGPFGSYEAAE